MNKGSPFQRRSRAEGGKEPKIGSARGAADQPPDQVITAGGLGVPLGSAMTFLFRTQYGSLIRFCRVRVRSEADAEDIVQSAFLAARRAYPDKGVDELRPLLFTLVRNMAISHLKLHWNKLRHGADISEVAAGFACPQSPTPEKLLMDTESLVIVEEVLAEMSPRRREMLRLHRYEGLSYEEIARRLSVSSMAVKRHVALAVAAIARRLAEAEGRDEDPAG